MSEATWKAVDEYLTQLLVSADLILDETLRTSREAGLPSIQVSPTQGKLLHLLVKLHGAKKVLEIGTLGGYSTTWLARALPADGHLISLEYSPKHADVARDNIERAKLSNLVEIRVGAALDSLPLLETEGAAPFDFIFIDADKPNNPAYLEWALKLSKAGTVIVVDNVIKDGTVIDSSTDNPSIVGTRQMFERMAEDSRLSTTVIQTVGSKGYDGFALAIVNEEK